MTTGIYIEENRLQVTNQQPIVSKFKRFVVASFHPRSLFIKVIGAIWILYCLWYRQLEMAIGIWALTTIVAAFSVSDVDPDLMVQSRIGKIALLHLEPMNLFVQAIGGFIILYGFWERSAESALIGLSILLAGHLYGWGKVDERLANYDL